MELVRARILGALSSDCQQRLGSFLSISEDWGVVSDRAIAAFTVQETSQEGLEDGFESCLFTLSEGK